MSQSYAKELRQCIINARRDFMNTNLETPGKVYLPPDYCLLIGKYMGVLTRLDPDEERTIKVHRPLREGDRIFGMGVVPTDDINMSIEA